MIAPEPLPARIRVGLVDAFVFTRGCVIEALVTRQQDFSVRASATVTKLLSVPGPIDVLLYYDHEHARPCLLDPLWKAEVLPRSGDIPVIVLSDAVTEFDAAAIRTALASGVRGFIATRTFEIGTMSAVIRFVVAGGIFAPGDRLPTADERAISAQNVAAPLDGLLTPRQAAVLSLLETGKANKIIAHELGMSENTVKVHLRAIMHRIGATNRTQAIYKLQQLSHSWAAEANAASRL